MRTHGFLLAPRRARRVASFVTGLGLAVLAGCVSGPPPVTPDMVNRARATWPDASLAALAHGHDTFVAKCQRCHALPSPDEKSNAEWPKFVDDMGKRASLSSGEHDDVLHYLLAARNH